MKAPVQAVRARPAALPVDLHVPRIPRGEAGLRSQLAARIAALTARWVEERDVEVVHGDVVPSSLVERFAGAFAEAFVVIDPSRDRVVGFVGASTAASAEGAAHPLIRRCLADGLSLLPHLRGARVELDPECVAFLELEEPRSGATVRAFLALEALPAAPRYRSPFATRSLPIELGIQIARLSVRLGELRSLGCGDVLVCEDGEAFGYRGVIEGASHEFVLGDEDSSLVIRGQIPREKMEDTRMQTSTDGLSPIGDAIVEVAIESARIVTTLSELEALAIGSVLVSKRAISSDVTLRVGGQPVARGRLVEVDGQLGVEITELAAAEPTTLGLDASQ